MLLAELATFLQGKGRGTPGTDLFYGPLKEDLADACISLHEYGGIGPEVNMSDINQGQGQTLNAGRSVRLSYPSVQVFVRGVKDDYDGPRARIQLIYQDFISVYNQTLSGVLYLAIEPAQEPFFLVTDRNLRNVFVFNAHVTKEQS